MGNSKIVLGDKTLIDLTGDTVNEQTLVKGATAHDAAGNLIVGQATGSTLFDDLTEEQRELIRGAQGEKGVGIQSIVQTTTSNADAGTNIVTVTWTNGQKNTFTFKNGSKGSPGITGPKGDPGEPSKTTVVLAVLTVDGWEGGYGAKNGQFVHEVTVNGVTGGTEIILVEPYLFNKEADDRRKIIQAFNNGPACCHPQVSTDLIQFRCDEKPTIDIPIQIGVIS